MRSLLALVSVLCVTLAGCVTLADPVTVVDESLALEPGGTWSRSVPLDQTARHELTVTVTRPQASDVAVCVDTMRTFRGPIDWSDEDWITFRGCERLPAEEGVHTLSKSVGERSSAPELSVHCYAADEACRMDVEVTARSARDADAIPFLVGGVLVLVGGGRVVADRMDRARIRDFVRTRGGRVESIAWQPFGRGWFGERGERVYRVEFVDREGRRRGGTFKTSLWSGVWTDAMPGEV